MGLSAGQEINCGKYTVVKALGQGRNCVSYLARDRYNQNWAIKTLRDDVWEGLSKDDRDRIHNKLLEEATILSRFQHPHIVRFKKPFSEDGRLYLVMEHIAGDDLATLPQKTLSETDALTYIQQIGSALHAVHQAGLVHRDVKPTNIMLRAGKAEAVLIDFGLSKGFDQTLTASSLTTTDGFAAPELYDSNAKPKAYSDIYGLAATLYVLLTGETPPSAPDRSRHLLGKKKLKSPQHLNPALQERTSQGIMKAMELDYTKRPQSVPEFLALLNLTLPAVTLNNPVEQESLNHARTQTQIGKQTLYSTVIIGILSLILAIALGLFGEDIKNWLRPSPVDSTPSSESVDE